MNRLGAIAGILIIVGLILSVIGSTAEMNWEGGTGDWWGAFGILGLLILFGGLGCLVVRIFQVLFL